MSKAQRLSTWRSFWRATTSIRSISTARTTSIPMASVAVEVLRVIGAAMAKVGVVGVGRLTLSRRERMVVVQPRGAGVTLFALRAAAEVRAPQFGSTEGDLDAEMVAIAGRSSGSGLAISTRVPTATVIRRRCRADRGEDERVDHQAAGSVNAIAGDRFNGRLETQPCAGTIRAGANSGKKQASEADSSRSTSARIAFALSRGSQNKTTALSRAGGHPY